MQKILNKQSLQNIIILILLLFLISCENTPSTETVDVVKKEVKISNESKSLNNKGVGEMGYFNYTSAAETFEELLKLNPDWALAKQNLAIALLNRQKPGDEEMAMKMAETLSAENNNNLVAHYIVAILKFNQGLCEDALPRFNTIIENDNSDAYALYFAGQCELQNGNIDKSLSLYQDAIKTDSYLRSAYYGGFMAAQRLQKNDLAKEMLEAYQKLDSNPRAKLAEIKYTRMGPKAIAQSVFSQNNPIQKAASAPFFQPPTALSIDSNSIQNYGLVNLHQSDQSQLYVISSNQLKIYDNFLTSPNEMSQFTINLGEDEHEHKVAWGDINNDNKIDAYITGFKDQLYIQNETGFETVDMSEFGFNQLSSIAVRFSDADHDGDLDILLLNNSGQFEIWNNNLNNTFTALSEKTKLSNKQGFKAIYLHDLDSDRDTDIILQSDNQITLLINDRMWDYQIIESEVFEKTINSLSLSDNDTNGKPELNVLTANSGISTWQLSQGSLKQKSEIANLSATQHISVDTNGNGVQEHVLMETNGIKIIDNFGNIQEQIMADEVESFKLLNTINGPELIFSANQQLFHSAASANRLSFVLLSSCALRLSANSRRDSR